MIRLINATKYYKTQGEKKYILNNVNITIPSGVNVGILGKNGMGKSTFLKILAGIDFPTSGHIVSNNSFSWVMGLSKGLQPAMTGRQNVKFICRIYGKDENELKEICNNVKEFSELEDYFDMPINSYSSGMKSRLTFGMSLAFDFDYLIIDEILSVGDAGFKQKSRKALEDKMLHSNILMVSHSMDELKELCDVGLLIDKGTVTYFEHIEDAIEAYNNLNKLKEKKVYSEDDLVFDTIQDAAKHYKVRLKSIQQALTKNGSNIWLQKVFWFEGSNKPKFEIWNNLKDNKEAIISSDGIIFINTKEAYYFYTKVFKDRKIDSHHLDDILKTDGYSNILKVNFEYISEYCKKNNIVL
jgi:capsular polysaccharide transport system ATP-binding protein